MRNSNIRSASIDRQVADLIDDQEPRHGVELELLVQAAFRQGPGEGRDQGRGRGEEHAIAVFDGLEAQAHGQVRLADPRRAEDNHILSVLDEVTAGQGLELLLVDRGLVAEVKGVQPLDEGEARQLGAHGDVLGRLGSHLFGEDLIEEVGVGELLGRGLLQEGLEPLPTREQAQAPEMLLEAFELGGAHDVTPVRTWPAGPDSCLLPGARVCAAGPGSTISGGAGLSVPPESRVMRVS